MNGTTEAWPITQRVMNRNDPLESLAIRPYETPTYEMTPGI